MEERMNKKILLLFVGLGMLSGCVTTGTLEKPLKESFLERADGSIVGRATFRESIDNTTSFLTFYKKDEQGRLVVNKETDPTTTPTVAGQAAVGAATAFFGSAPIAGSMVGGQAVATSAAKSIARTHANVARESMEASKHAAPSTIFNLMPVANSLSESGASILNRTTLSVPSRFAQ